MSRIQKVKDMSELIDSWRVFPRLFICFYFWLTYSTTTWFMALAAPNAEQSAFVIAVVGAGAAWFGMYLNTKPRVNDAE